MARYVCLLRFSPHGVRNIKQSPTRAATFRKATEKAGVKVEVLLRTAGAPDGVLILNGDEKKLLGTITRLAARGHVHPQSMPAFDATEFAAIVC